MRKLIASALMALTLGGSMAALVPAAAAAKPAPVVTHNVWSSSYGGVSYGWSNNHVWAIASYQTLGATNIGAIAGVVCAVAHLYAPACAYAAGAAFVNLTRGHPRWTNHGAWIALYPHGGRFGGPYLTGGRY